MAEAVEEDARLVHVPHQKVNAELTQHRNIKLDINRVGIEVASDLGRWQEASWLGLSHDPSLGLRHVDGVLAVLGTDTRDKAHISPKVLGQRYSIATGDLVCVLVVEVDQVQGDLPALLLVTLK